MRIWVLSDIHLEHASWHPPKVSADVVVLAGDLFPGPKGLQWARRSFPDLPILFVPGNHEYYHGHFQTVLAALRAEGRRLEIHVLDGDEVVLGGVRFLGATLWTDFELAGADPRSIRESMDAARMGMNDFRLIRFGESGCFQPEHARQIHQEQRQWLQTRLQEPGLPTVVISHHLPHPLSIHPRFAGSSYNAAFASDLGALMGSPVSLWIHGHTHESVDYTHRGTRVFCNPRGYVPYEPNPHFDPRCMVEVSSTPKAAQGHIPPPEG